MCVKIYDNFLPNRAISVDIAHKTQFSHLSFRTEVLLTFHRTKVTLLMADLLLKYDFFKDVILISFFSIKKYCLNL